MGKKILLADDSITIQKVIELTFSDEDFEVVTVGNGRLAVEKVQDVRPDLVLCDIIMPEKDGYEVCDFIKKTPSLAHIPVLLLTGAFEPFDQDRANRVGCDGFLAKPFEPQTLIARVKDLLNQAATRTQSGPRPVAAPATVPLPEPLAGGTPYPAPTVSAFAPSAAPSAPRLRPEPEPEPESAFISDEPLEETPTMVSPAYDMGAASPYDEPPIPPPMAEAPPEELSYVEELSEAEDELMDVSPEESATLQGDTEAEPEPEEEPGSAPSSWALPTVEVPLEMRAQAGVEAAHTPEPAFEDVFEEEAPAPAAPAHRTEDFGFVRTQDVIGSPAAPSVPSAAAPETVREGFGWVRQADLPGTPPAPPSAHPFASSAGVSAPEPDKRAPEPFEEEPGPAESSFGSVSSSAPEPPAPPSEAAEVGVPMDMVEKIAQRVVAQISEKVIREIAWEVIPDLAESLIKKEIDRLKAELQRT
jgi:CheY-like chemotaxis protein